MPTENKIRITAFLVFILTILYITTHSIWIPLFLLIDFAFRGSGYGKWSVLGFLAEKIVSIFNLEQKPIYFPTETICSTSRIYFFIDFTDF